MSESRVLIGLLTSVGSWAFLISVGSELPETILRTGRSHLKSPRQSWRKKKVKKKKSSEVQTDTHLLFPCFELARQTSFFLARFQLAVGWPERMAPRPDLPQPASSGRAEEICLNLLCCYSSRHWGLVEDKNPEDITQFSQIILFFSVLLLAVDLGSTKKP